MPSNTPRGYPRALGSDNWRTYLKTNLAAGLDLIDADMTAALAGAAGASQLNLLVNPGFEVFQRTTTPITADLAYAHDRWQLDLGGTSTCSITDETTIIDTGSGHALKAVYTHGSAVSLVDQKLEHYLQLRGRTLTFEIRVRKGVASSVRPYIQDTSTKTYGSTSATTGSFTTMTVTLAIGAAATAVRVGVELSISDTVYLDSAVLAVGATAPAFVPLTPADDLARCHRYYRIWPRNAGNTGEIQIGFVYAGSAAQTCSTTVLFGPAMGGTPTFTKEGTWGTTNCGQPSVAAGGPSGFRFDTAATAAGVVVCNPDGSGDNVIAEWNPA